MGLARAEGGTWAVFVAIAFAATETLAFDLVVAGGRVIDPASGLDAVRSVGLEGGRITAIEDGRPQTALCGPNLQSRCRKRKCPRHKWVGAFAFHGARDQIRTGNPHVGNVLLLLKSLMFTCLRLRRGA